MSSEYELNSILRALEHWGGTEDDVRRLTVKVLKYLGWNTMDATEVRKEYELERGAKPDYTLFLDEKPQVIVEARGCGDMDEACDQIERYERGENRYIGAATDCKSWRIIIDGEWSDAIKVDENIRDTLSSISRAEMEDYKLLKLFKIDVSGCEDVKRWIVNIEETNNALRCLNRFVVANKERFVDVNRFNHMLRTYANVIMIVRQGEKQEIVKLLDDGDVFGGLKNADMIVRLCYEGKYEAIQRALRRINNKPYMNSFLNLLEAFSKDGQYDEQKNTLKRFINRYSNVREDTIKPALLTGILASLQPEEFMVYDRRSYEVLEGTSHSNLAGHASLGNYIEFNDVYRKYRRKLKKSLIDLDNVANCRYLGLAYCDDL